MMEMSKFPEDPILDTSDDTTDSTQSEDADKVPDPENIPGSSESAAAAAAAAAQDPLPHGGRNRPKKSGTVPSKRSGKLNESGAPVPKMPTSNLSFLIFNAVANSRKKNGVSVQALKKIVAGTGYDMAKKKHYFLRSIRNMVAKGQLWQIKGTGATGSFKVNPEIKMKTVQRMKRKVQKAKCSNRKKRSAASKKAQEAAKKQAKANVKKSCTRGKMSSVQAASTQLQV